MKEGEGKKAGIRKLSLIILLAVMAATTLAKFSCDKCDADKDGYWIKSTACYQSYVARYAPNSFDCNDLNPAVHPGALEICDGVDNDCNGVMLEGEVTDADGDGSPACLDCDDNNAAVFPGAEEVCDGVDNNCDGKLLDGETVDRNQNGILACVPGEDDTLLEAVVEIKPDKFNTRIRKFTAFVVLQEGFDTNLITKCVADGAVATEIVFDEGVAVCTFNTDDITELPIDILFEVSGETSDGFTFLGSYEVDKIL